MSSSRESSPTSEVGSTSIPLLSPTSKVKALLANFSDDSDASDKRSVSGDARARLMRSLQKTTKPPGPVSSEDREAIGHATSSEDEEEEVMMPRGRLAAAMRGLARSSSPAMQSNHTSPKRLAKRSSPAKSTSSQHSSVSDAASEDSDIPVASRKRRIRTTRRPTPQPTSEERPESPGLFVSPAKSTRSAADTSDSDELPEDTADSRFKALVERKRKEMQAREDAAEALRVKRAEERKRLQDSIEADDLDMSDGEGGRRLTQQAKPTRKASKKALEEMHRESQRLSRNQQLAHYATTKKKYTTKDFLKRFQPQTANAPREGTPELPAHQQASEPISSSPAGRSDEDRGDTPPTSPPSLSDDLPKLRVPSLPRAVGPTTENEKIPTLEDEFPVANSIPEPKLAKGKGKAVETFLEGSPKSKQSMSMKRQIRIRPVQREKHSLSLMGDSDSDLEIVETKHDKLKVKLEAAFSRVPAKKSAEDQSLYTLQMLAHLKSPGKQNNKRHQKPSMTTSELQTSLQQKARQQAAREREEKLEDLRRRGIVVQSTEERQKEMAEVEDLIAKARREVDELAKKEKADAKRERKENGEVDPLGDSSDDEDWEENPEKTAEDDSASGSDLNADVESNSGSSEEDEEEMEVDGEAANHSANPMFDEEASETEDDEVEEEVNLSLGEHFIDDGENEEEEEALPALRQQRRARNINVISDEEDESHDELRTPILSRKPISLQTDGTSPLLPTSVLRSATKTFIPGVTVTGPVGLGLTQIFAGTMDDSQLEQSQSQPPETPTRNNAMSFLRRENLPSLPPFVPTMSEEETQAFPDSQMPKEKVFESQSLDDESQGIQLNFTQSQIHGFDSLLDNSQGSPFPVTQDVGFANITPMKDRFATAPTSTVDTMILDSAAAVPEDLHESPIVNKKGKLRRRAPQVFSDDEDVGEPAYEAEDLEINENVFDVMRKASKKKVVVDEFDKKNSKAKEMVEEQANESEDEYAGLGGASDDESDGEADEYVKAMIDDEGSHNVDKSKIAAFFADRERAKDEKEIEKLYKDITSGMMRRKRGADYDLSDSDDGGEARRRMKQKEFAKMRKALLADERIGKIAENPKRQAFLRAIEDRGSEDEMNFLDDFPEQEESQSQSQSQSQAELNEVVPNSQPGDMGPPKRKRTDDFHEEERLPPHLRRTKPAKRPSNLSEIRESLSSLIEEQNSFVAPADTGSDSEDDLEIDMEGDDNLAPRQQKDKENRDPFSLRRTNAAVIDRISLKRESSSTVSNSARLAFAVSSGAPGFKVPALLRKATTNSSITSNASTAIGTSSTERTAGGSSNDGIRRGGGKNSGVNYFARETERRASLAKTEARREKKRFRGAEDRRKVVGGILGAGKFE